MHLLKTFGILLIVIAIFGGAMFGLNFYTGPIIEANNAGAANDRLNAVMPDGKAYKDITATLSGVPASVVKVHKETNGLGYVIECTATSQYTGGAPMDIVIGVDATGKICGINLNAYSDSIDFRTLTNGDQFLPSFIGKDSALTDVGTVTGATFSSAAFRNAVSDAMSVLIANNLISAGVKPAEQIFAEMIPTLHTGLSADGILKASKITASGNIIEGYKATNGSGFALIMQKGDAKLLAIVNATGACKIFDVDGNNVTASHADLVTEATTYAAASQTDYTTKLSTKVAAIMTGATNVTKLDLDTFNTVSAAVSFTVEDVTYYAFYSRSIGWTNHVMDVYFVIDETGAIVKMTADQFIFEEKYFSDFGGMNAAEYKDGFVGLTPETWNDDVAVIATATMTSNAIKQSTKDAFAAFNSINEGGAQ